MDDWIDLKEAADRIGYSVNYFRRLYCNSTAPLVMIHERRGPTGRRRILVNAADLDWVMEAMIVRPDGGANGAQ